MRVDCAACLIELTRREHRLSSEIKRFRTRLAGRKNIVVLNTRETPNKCSVAQA